tara:strand:- start:27857 stop:28102 length:246 start_codon:yes stop_codon:yes gene_type:complete
MLSTEELIHDMLDRFNYDWEIFERDGGLDMHRYLEAEIIDLFEKYKPSINQDIVTEIRKNLRTLQIQIDQLVVTPEGNDNE